MNCAYHEQNSGLIYQAHEQGAEVYPSIGECSNDSCIYLLQDGVLLNIMHTIVCFICDAL